MQKSAMTPAIDSSLPRLSGNGRLSPSAEHLRGKLGLKFHNWAQTFTCQPELYFQPESISEVQDIVKLARRNQKHLTVVGAGHSPGDIVCTEDYMVSLDKLSNIISVDRRHRLVKVEAGMRLYQLHWHLEQHGLAMSNLGSISEQSLGGFIATATHGSSLKHSILSQNIVELTMILADSSKLVCSAKEQPETFLAALVSLGALGVIVDITFRVSDAYDIVSKQSILTFDNMLSRWAKDDLWERAEFVRVWWFPYSKKTILWEGDRVEAGSVAQKSSKSWYRGMFWAYHVQQALLSLGRFLPSMGPAIERAVFRNQYGVDEGEIGSSVEKSYISLNMNCLFSQYVNEWSIPLEKGIEACKRLELWLDGKEEEAGIPFSSKGIFIHAPIELRVAKAHNNEAWLSPAWGGAVCYIGVIMYKPFHQPVPYRRYFQAYEYLMNSLGGRPHWAKQHNVPQRTLLERYPKLADWLSKRQELDPEEMFTTEYHRRHLLSNREDDLGVFEGMSGRKYKSRL